MLTEAQERTLAAVVDRVVPPDETWPDSGWPGGVEAGVLDYLREQFRRDLADLVPHYRRFLDALDAEAAPATFADLPPEAQDALLRRVEQGDVRATGGWGNDLAFAPQFFRRVVEHVAEGFYTSPAGRRMVRFEAEEAAGVTA